MRSLKNSSADCTISACDLIAFIFKVTASDLSLALRFMFGLVLFGFVIP